MPRACRTGNARREHTPHSVHASAAGITFSDGSFFTLFSLHGQVCSADCKFAQETRNYLGKMGQTSGAKYQGCDPAYDRPPARAHASLPPSATSWRWGWKRPALPAHPPRSAPPPPVGGGDGCAVRPAPRPTPEPVGPSVRHTLVASQRGEINAGPVVIPMMAQPIDSAMASLPAVIPSSTSYRASPDAD